MSSDKRFEIASRKGYRWAIPGVGKVATEDLWNLPMSALDTLYRSVNEAKQKLSASSGLIQTPKNTVEVEDLDNQLELIKYVYTVRMEEVAAAKAANKRREERETLRRLIDEKEQQGLLDLPLEELKKRLAEAE